MGACVIALANQKGGVGKTTTAVNLAAYLALRGKRVLLLDLDPQSNATSGLGVATKPGCSVYANLLSGEAVLNDKIRSTAIKYLDLLPSEIDLAGAEVDMARRERYLHGLKDIFDPLLARTRYDFAFIDCPPSLGILTMNALTAAHFLLIPSQCEYLALEGLSVITRLVSQLRQSGANPRLEIEGIVMTMYDGRTNLAAQVVEEVRGHFGDKMFATIIPRNIRLSEAPSFGKPIALYDRNSTGARAYRDLAREFLKRRAAPAPAVSEPGAAPGNPAQPLTSRERLRRCFFHEELDRPGVYVRTGFPDADPSYDRLRNYLQEHSDLKVGWPGDSVVAPFAVESFKEPHSEDFERVVQVLRTPKGELRATRFHSLKGQPGLQESFFIKTVEDAERYLSLPLPEIGGDVAPFFEADRRIEERGIVDVSLGVNPAGAVVTLTGSEAFALLSVANRDLMHALCERRMTILLQCVTFLLDHKVGPFFSMSGEEYVAPPLHGPRDFQDFNVKYDKPILDCIHEAGGRVHIHCHGRLKAVFQAFVDMGADVLHPFEGPPMGDITPKEAKEMARGKLCLEGNIQIAAFYERSPDQIREETRALIADAFDDRCGLIVSATASPYIRGAGEKCFEPFKAMVDAAREWRPPSAV